MSWKSHWCEQAMKIAGEKGWRIGEIAGAKLAFEVADGHVETIDFTDALQKAVVADAAASEAITAAVEKMTAHIEVLKSVVQEKADDK